MIRNFQKLLSLVLLMTFNHLGFAEVESIDVYFLSRPTGASIYSLPLFKPQFKGLYTQNEMNEDCLPMGDGCFHPQYGYIEDEKDLDQKKQEADIEKAKPIKLKTINSQEVDLINCDDEYYFDLYCGKAKKEKAKQKTSETEIWIDTSSSMRLVDYSSEDAYCDRRRFVVNFRQSCKKDISFNIFNTAKKRLSTLDNLCINHGTNDGDRVVQWLKSSEAKHVVIITDMEEYVGAFREYLDSRGANIHGIGVDPLLATELVNLKEEFKAFCK